MLSVTGGSGDEGLSSRWPGDLWSECYTIRDRKLTGVQLTGRQLTGRQLTGRQLTGRQLTGMAT
ncbi:hypothetical protein GCM10027169_35960 [Gordonia jinhuaensis]